MNNRSFLLDFRFDFTATRSILIRSQIGDREMKEGINQHISHIDYGAIR